MVYGLRKGAGYNYAGVVGECQMPFECIDLFAFWFCSHSAVLFGKFVAPDAMVIEKNAVERKSQRLQCPFPYSRLQLAFPYCDAMPSHRGKLALVFYVTITVAFNLRFPEFSVALWNHIISASFVSMPEAAVHEDARPVFAKHDVRMTRETWMVQPIAKPSAEQEFPYHDFWFGVLTTY